MRIVLLTLLLSACHARFKKHAPIIQRAHVEVNTLTGPDVLLGQAEGEGLASAAVNVLQTVKGIELTRDIAAAVDTNKMNERFAGAFVDALGDGPPFAASTKGKGSLVSVDVLNWGMFVPSIGVQGTFTYTVRVRVYMPDGKQVYSNREVCTMPVGDPDAFAQALGAVNNAKVVDDMSRKAIRQAFYGTARGCASVVVAQMRKHAG